MSQIETFDSAVKRLYFGIDILKASGALVDSFLTVADLHHNEKVIRQSNLNLYMELKTDKEAWWGQHIFTFIKSPFPDLKKNQGILK